MTADQTKQQEADALALMTAKSEAAQFRDKFHAALDLLAEFNGKDKYHWNDVVAAKMNQKPSELGKYCPRCGFKQ